MHCSAQKPLIAPQYGHSIESPPFPSSDELATPPQLLWKRSAKSSVIPRLTLEVLLIPIFSFFDCSSDRVHLRTIQTATGTVFGPKNIGSSAHLAGQKNHELHKLHS